MSNTSLHFLAYLQTWLLVLFFHLKENNWSLYRITNNTFFSELHRRKIKTMHLADFSDTEKRTLNTCTILSQVLAWRAQPGHLQLDAHVRGGEHSTHLSGWAVMCFCFFERRWQPLWHSGWISASFRLLQQSPQQCRTGCRRYAPVCTSLHLHWCSWWWLFLKSPSVCLAFWG